MFQNVPNEIAADKAAPASYQKSHYSSVYQRTARKCEPKRALLEGGALSRPSFNDRGLGFLCQRGDPATAGPPSSIYTITCRSVIIVSTRCLSLSNSSSESVFGMSIKGNRVTVTLENGFGIAKPSHDLSRQYDPYSI